MSLLGVLTVLVPIIIFGVISLGISRSFWDFHAAVLGEHSSELACTLSLMKSCSHSSYRRHHSHPCSHAHRHNSHQGLCR